MSNETSSEKIRQAIAWQLARLGADDASKLHESILIRHGLFCGRKFECQNYQVVWFLEEDEIKFFSPVGELLKSCSSADCLLESQATDQKLPRAA